MQRLISLLLLLTFVGLAMSGCAPPLAPLPSTPIPTPTVPTTENQQEEVYHVLYPTGESERYILPTFEELERERDGLARNYPQTVKGVWEPGSAFANRLIRKRLPELRDVGVNTFHVLPHYFYVNDELVLQSVLISAHQGKLVSLTREKAEREYIDQAVKAKKAGFAVSITPIYFGGPVEAVPDPDAFDEFALQQARKWAQIAEEYQVEYFSPFGEYEKHMSGQGLSKAALVERVNSWNRKALAEVRPIFKGKIVLKVSPIGLDSYSAQSASGYDIVAICFSIGRTANPEEKYNWLPESLQRHFSEAQVVAERDDVEWMVGDFVLRSEGCTEELRVELSRIVFEEYKKTLKEEQKPVGFTFFAWEMPEGKIRDTEIVPFLKQFFSEI